MPALTEARLQAHWAVQLASAPGTTLLDNSGDYANTNLEWSHDRQALVGRPIDGRAAGLRVADLTLLVGDDTFSLAGRTYEEGLAWLAERFGAPLKRSDHEMPAHAIADGAAFERVAGLAELAETFARAQDALAPLGLPVRCWPHHFDLAVFVDLGDGKSIGAGLSPGDGSYGDPYWYITPWPYPEDRANLPGLSVGGWHIEGWVGAVLPGAEPGAAFVAEAVAACRGLFA